MLFLAWQSTVENKITKLNDPTPSCWLLERLPEWWPPHIILWELNPKRILRCEPSVRMKRKPVCEGKQERPTGWGQRMDALHYGSATRPINKTLFWAEFKTSVDGWVGFKGGIEVNWLYCKMHKNRNSIWRLCDRTMSQFCRHRVYNLESTML